MMKTISFVQLYSLFIEIQHVLKANHTPESDNIIYNPLLTQLYFITVINILITLMSNPKLSI